MVIGTTVVVINNNKSYNNDLAIRQHAKERSNVFY